MTIGNYSSGGNGKRKKVKYFLVKSLPISKDPGPTLGALLSTGLALVREGCLAGLFEIKDPGSLFPFPPEPPLKPPAPPRPPRPLPPGLLPGALGGPLWGSPLPLSWPPPLPPKALPALMAPAGAAPPPQAGTNQGQLHIRFTSSKANPNGHLKTRNFRSAFFRSFDWFGKL